MLSFSLLVNYHVGQSVYFPVSLLVSQSIRQLVYWSDSQLIGPFVGQSAYWLVKLLISLLFSLPNGKPVSPLVSQYTSQSVFLLVGQSFGQSVCCHSVYWSVITLVSQSICQLAYWSVSVLDS